MDFHVSWYPGDPDYACYDEDNQPVYYLVEEADLLAKLRQRTLLSKLGLPQTEGPLKK